MRNLGRSRVRTLITVVSLFLSAALLVVMFSGVLTLHQALQGNITGRLCAASDCGASNCWLCDRHPAILSQRSRSTLTACARSDNVKSGFYGRSAGGLLWIQRLFVHEGLILALLGTIPGARRGSMDLDPGETSLNLCFPLLCSHWGLLLLMLLVSAFAAIPAVRALNRMHVADCATVGVKRG